MSGVGPFFIYLRAVCFAIDNIFNQCEMFDEYS